MCLTSTEAIWLIRDGDKWEGRGMEVGKREWEGRGMEVGEEGDYIPVATLSPPG